MVGLVLEVEDGVIAGAGLAVGACSAAAMRLSWLESELTGRRLNAGLANRVKPEHLDALAPIDDIRAGSAHRRLAALTLVRRALVALEDRKSAGAGKVVSERGNLGGRRSHKQENKK